VNGSFAPPKPPRITSLCDRQKSHRQVALHPFLPLLLPHSIAALIELVLGRREDCVSLNPCSLPSSKLLFHSIKFK